MIAKDIPLREGGAADLTGVMRVMAEAFEPAFGEAWTPAQCLGILDLPGVWLTLAGEDGDPAGFALSRIILDEAELLLLGVRPSFRRQGIGSALLSRAISIASDAGARRLHLEVRNGNEALNLYKQMGFTQVGRRPAYYRGAAGQLFDALSFSISIAAVQKSNMKPK